MFIKTPLSLNSPIGLFLIIAAAENLQTLTVPITLIYKVFINIFVSKTPFGLAMTPNYFQFMIPIVPIPAQFTTTVNFPNSLIV